ncbi:hypothetical protein CRENBAI_021197 [Crenichthys baileyi]|uniref:Uncharacterized protein n=1 Tax=Crenichthys baileyi TaxID=28760 RepID=A0AAV9REM0_9TELE
MVAELGEASVETFFMVVDSVGGANELDGGEDVELDGSDGGVDELDGGEDVELDRLVGGADELDGGEDVELDRLVGGVDELDGGEDVELDRLVGGADEFDGEDVELDGSVGGAVFELVGEAVVVSNVDPGLDVAEADVAVITTEADRRRPEPMSSWCRNQRKRSSPESCDVT